VVGCIERFINTHRVVVVCERFHVGAQTHKKTAQPAALEVAGSLRDLAVQWDCDFVLQPPSLAKRYKDQTLRRAGLHTPGLQGHANDAMRHVLAALLSWSPEDIVRLLQLDMIDTDEQGAGS
jgi:hypothetical protein